jgi:hypothetical protein
VRCEHCILCACAQDYRDVKIVQLAKKSRAMTVKMQATATKLQVFELAVAARISMLVRHCFMYPSATRIAAAVSVLEERVAHNCCKSIAVIQNPVVVATQHFHAHMCLRACMRVCKPYVHSYGHTAVGNADAINT